MKVTSHKEKGQNLIVKNHAVVKLEEKYIV